MLQNKETNFIRNGMLWTGYLLFFYHYSDPVFHMLLTIMRKTTFDMNDFTALVLAQKNLLIHEAVS